MLVADAHSQIRIPAWMANRGMAPFFCPECRKEVTLHQGRIRVHHYKHKPPVDCPYGLGESDLHWRAKRGIYDALCKESTVRNVYLEHRIEGTRPDVYFEQGGARIAIEVQKTGQTLDQIDFRTRRYTEIGINVLWVMPDNEPKWIPDEDGPICRTQVWQDYLHTMYFGRIYFWQHDAVVRPAHLGKFYRDVPAGNWVEDYEDQIGEELSETNWYQENYEGADYGGGRRLVKTYKRVSWLGRNLDIANDFRPSSRKHRLCPRYSVPACNIWVDNNKKWWKD